MGLTSGIAEIRGAVVCSQQAFVSIFGRLQQQHAGQTLTGFFGTFIPCDGTTSWGAVIQVLPTLFRGRAAALFVAGPALVEATAFVFDPDTGMPVQLSFSTNIILTGSQ